MKKYILAFGLLLTTTWAFAETGGTDWYTSIEKTKEIDKRGNATCWSSEAKVLVIKCPTATQLYDERKRMAMGAAMKVYDEKDKECDTLGKISSKVFDNKNVPGVEESAMRVMPMSNSNDADVLINKELVSRSITFAIHQAHERGDAYRFAVYLCEDSILRFIPKVYDETMRNQ